MPQWWRWILLWYGDFVWFGLRKNIRVLGWWVFFFPVVFFRLPINPFVVKASSPFIYFSALNSRSIIEVSGVLPKEKTRLGSFNHAWKVIIITCSSASLISNIALLKRFTYSLKVSLSCCFIVNRYEGGLLCRWPLIKFQTKESLNCLKFVIDDAGNLLNHTL